MGLIICDNGICQITGKRQTATAGVTDVAAVAKGAGIPNSHWVRDEEHFMQLLVMQLLDRCFTEGRPPLWQPRSTTSPARSDTARSDSDPQSLHERARNQPWRAGRLISAPFAPKFVSGIEPTSL